MWKKIEAKEMTGNVFSRIGEQWMLVTAGDRTEYNTMTASWGGLGVLWGKNVATAYVRPQRYTYEFMERHDYFTLSFFSPEWKKQLAFCGAKSGREVDKAAECGFTLDHAAGDAPCFQEAELVLVCRKLYRQDLDPACFTAPEVDASCYPNHDYHRMYIGEIVEVLTRD